VLSPGSSEAALLFSKVVLSAGFTLGGTAVVERLGPRVGGLVAAVPQLAVVALIFFAIEQGLGFAAESAFWAIPGMCATLAVFLGYLAGCELVPAPRVASIATGVTLGTACFALGAGLVSLFPLSRVSVLPFAALACFGTTFILRKLPGTATLRRVSASPGLLLLRAGTAVATVLTVTGLAHLLGPKWSGLLVGYPVNSLPVMVILHLHYGRDVIKPFIKIFPAGIFGVCLFNLVAWLFLERLGLGLTVVLGYGVDIVYLMTVAWARGRIQVR
jgi:hypothetical protein